jgi:hypothetical protein
MDAINLQSIREDRVFKSLVEDVRRGKATLFIGAGVSVDVGLPTSADLVRTAMTVCSDYGISLDEKRKYKLSEIAYTIEVAKRRTEFIERIKAQFDAVNGQNPQPQCRGFYRLLRYLDDLDKPQNLCKYIFTTNWDDLIEMALRPYGFTVIRQDADINHAPTAKSTVIKLHGDFTNHNTMVISDNDYTKMLQKIEEPVGLAGSLWGWVSTLLAQNSCIFVGYRLADPNFRLLRRQVEIKHQGGELHQYMVGPIDDNQKADLEDRELVEVLPYTATPFFLALAQELARFTNREDDLEHVTKKEHKPFIEFYAPFGAGKSALLNEIEQRVKVEGWQDHEIIRINLGTENLDSITPAIQNKNRIFILIDQTEKVQEDSWRRLTSYIDEHIFPRIKDQNKSGQRTRLILSGRYPIRGWPFAIKKYLDYFALSPFSINSVGKMVDKYVIFRDPKAQAIPPSDELVRQIFEMTGGCHPGFIIKILNDLLGGPNGEVNLPLSLPEQKIDQYLDSFLTTIHDQVWASAPQTLENLFTYGLCVLRRLNQSLLDHLKSKSVFDNLLSPIGDVDTVIQQLKDCSMVVDTGIAGEIDPVIRRIQCQKLQRDKTRSIDYIAIHDAAAEAWQNLLSLPYSDDETQLLYCHEWLYHRITCLSNCDHDYENARNELMADIDSFQFRASGKFTSKMGEMLLSKIEGDQELIDLISVGLDAEEYEELRTLILRKETRVAI